MTWNAKTKFKIPKIDVLYERKMGVLTLIDEVWHNILTKLPVCLK